MTAAAQLLWSEMIRQPSLRRSKSSVVNPVCDAPLAGVNVQRAMYRTCTALSGRHASGWNASFPRLLPPSVKLLAYR